MNSKYYHEFQILSWTPAYLNVLIVFTYLMASKLRYLLRNWEIVNWLPAFEHVWGVIRALQTPMMVLLTKTVCNASLKTLPILAKRLILDAWLGLGRLLQIDFISFSLTLTFFMLQWNSCSNKLVCQKHSTLTYVNKYNMRKIN